MRRLALLALIALALPAAGTAAFPGTNGRILFTQELEHIDRFASRYAHLCAAPGSGQRPTKAVEPPQGQWLEHPAVAPDGGTIAYSRGGDLFTASVDGTGERRLTAGSMPAWTPDGRVLYFESRGDLYVIRADGSALAAFVTSTGYEQMPAVSPDGRSVAYVRGAGFGTTGGELVLRELATGSERVLVASPGIAGPDWASAGDRLVFALDNAIATISAAGSDLRVLTTGGEAGEPAYSPDGTLIAFERAGDIWTMNTTGSGITNLTRSPVRERQPAWQTGTALQPAGSDRPCAIVGSDGGEELVGSPYADVFYDLAGDDTIRGLGGDDRFYDGDGLDRVEGGDGADFVLLRHGANVVYGGRGADEITGAARFGSPTTVAAPQRIYGEDGADRISGGTAADRIEGGPGADLLNGLKGPDLVLGGPGDDRLNGNRGDDSLNGNEGNDVLYGGVITGAPLKYDGYDLLTGGEGNDRLAGGWQKDRLFGGPGDDRLSGGPNADHLVGEAGTDLYLGDQGDDLLLARDRREEAVFGGPGFDRARLDPADRKTGVERTVR